MKDIKPRFEAGSVRSPLSKVLVAALQEAAPFGMHRAQLHQAALHVPGYADCTAERQWVLLRSRLANLIAGGHARRKKIDGQSYWFAHDAHVAAATPVTPPRREDLFGPVYVPKVVATRPGAMDFAELPSLQLGKRRPFKPGAGSPVAQ